MTERIERLKTTLAGLGDGQTRWHFFQSLRNPDLLDDLKQLGVFDAPYPIQRVDGGIVHAIWPPALYLQNIATAKPLDVRNIIADIKTSNRRIQSDLVRALAKMPAGIAESLAQTVAGWLRAGADDDRLLYSSLAYFEALVAGNSIRDAFVVAEVLVEVREPSEAETLQIETFRFADAHALVGDTHLDFVAETVVRTLGKADPIGTVTLFARKLNRALRYGGYKAGETDLSHIWRESLDDERISNGAKEKLTECLFETAKTALDADVTLLSGMLTPLQEYQAPIFDRIGISLISQFGTLEQAIDVLSKDSLYTHQEFGEERAQLLEKWFPRLPDAIKNNVLAKLQEGFDENAAREWLEEREHKTDIDETIAAERERYWWRRTVSIKEYLPPSERARHVAAESQFRDAEPPKGLWIGPESPLSEETLRSSRTEQLISYAENFEAPAGFMKPTPAGLGMKLQPLVAERFAEFVAQRDRIARLQPVYIYYILQGLRLSLPTDAMGEFVNFVTHMVEATGTTINGNATAPSESDDDGDDADDFRASVRQVAMHIASDLLKNGRLSPEHRESIWRCIELVLVDPDPDTERDSFYRVGRAFHAALNSARGSAFIALFDYGRWLHSARQASETLETLAPEVLNALHSAVVEAPDPSVAVASTLGHNLVGMFAMLPDWTRSNITSILGSDPVNLSDRETAAWETYLLHNTLYDSVYRVLAPYYYSAVERLSGDDAEGDRDGSPNEHLVAHIVALVARGADDLADEAGLANSVLRVGTPRLVGSMIGYAGRSLSAHVTPADMQARLISLFEAAIDRYHGSPAAQRAALSAFGWWLGAKQPLDQRWLLDNLILVLTMTDGKIEPSHQVIIQLAALTEEFPVHAVRAIGLMAKGSRPSDLMFSTDEVSKIFASAKAAGGESADAARDAMDSFIARGILTYRHLL